MTNRQKIQKTTTLAILTAIVIIFQLLGSFIHIGPVNLCLVLIPIAIGAILTGPKGGAFLGFVLGAITYFVNGMLGFELTPFTSILFAAQPIATAVICFGKGILAGLCTGLVYRAFEKKNKNLAVFLAAATTPIVNTGIFILGGLLLVYGTLSANFVEIGKTVISFLIISCAGGNFIAEFIANIIVAPAINTIVHAVGNKLSK